MILGVLLRRRAHLKTLSPVIDAGLARGHDVWVIGDPQAAKRGDRLDLREVARLWPAARRTTRDEVGWLNALVGITSTLPCVTTGLRLVGVDAFADCWLAPPRGPPGRGGG